MADENDEKEPDDKGAWEDGSAESGNVTSSNIDPAANGADNQPQIGVISQYVKDLSVENP